ncbi:NYN domain-containing protein [Paraburkholderia azotifigens]|uniref:NYN domain-containing protein n=1 Tax=Paraburkholderia azotifigens TaxID=2057004 RepID=UPI0038BB8F6B
MASSQDTVSMALFCDFENVALGVRDAKYEKFDIKLVLERLLLKGSIVVKKAYCDWDRYKGFKAAMHEANFELIEIPHVRQSGKNSADIRLVVDALDLCYTKSHVNTFVIISGDSDFSPLVSKLRENAKQVIGVGVQRSTSDLLTANCDEFIFYDDLVRESQRAAAKRDSAKAAQQAAQQATKRASEGEKRKEDLETRKTKAVELAVQTFDALASERGDSGKIWASVLKNAIKRRKPDFNETYYGFRAFGNLLEEAQSRGLLEVGRDEKSGTFVYRSASSGVAATAEVVPARESGDEWAAMPAAAEIVDLEEATVTASVEEDVPAEQPFEDAPQAVSTGHADAGKSDTRRKGRGTRKPAAKRAKKKTERGEATEGEADSSLAADTQHVPEQVAVPETHAPAPEAEHPATEAPAAKKKPSRKSTARSRRPRKTESANDAE